MSKYLKISIELITAVILFATAIYGVCSSKENKKEIERQNGELKIVKDSILVLQQQINNTHIEVKTITQNLKTNYTKFGNQTGEKNYQFKQGNIKHQSFE